MALRHSRLAIAPSGRSRVSKKVCVPLTQMPNSPFRRTPKIGRNDPCPCGSGRKFKLCHGRPQFELPNLVASANLEKQIIAEGRRQFERHKARELQRQKQQGLGRPIISMEHKGYRYVAVGNRVHYGKWKSFADFLTNYIKVTLGSEWGNAEIAKPLEERHPLMQWYDKICRLQAVHAKQPGTLYSMPVTGAVSAYNRLAYNLYLIAHNSKDIQTRLIARLKNKDNFQGAFFETQVAAWLINAGFELEYEDESDRKSKHCEFTATYMPTGEKYSVEAKSREIESSKSSRPKVGRKLYEALEKKANHKRLIFLNLNKPLHTHEVAEIAVDRAERIISQREGMKIDGDPAPPAYVCITNMSDQYALDTSTLGTMISFRGFKIHDFMGVEFPSLREAARARTSLADVSALQVNRRTSRDSSNVWGRIAFTGLCGEPVAEGTNRSVLCFARTRRQRGEGKTDPRNCNG